jgi:hypothetical protein
VRLAALPLALLGTTYVSLAVLATPAAARVEGPTSGLESTVGLQPREATFISDGRRRFAHNLVINKPSVNSFSNTNGNEVVHGAHGLVGTYVLYWDPQDYYHGDWQQLIDEFMANLGDAGKSLSNVFAIDSQYTDTSNSPAAHRTIFHGAFTDTHAYPQSGNCVNPEPFESGSPLLEGGATTVCLKDTQIRTELTRFVEAEGLPRGMNTIYYVLTPPGVAVCLDGGGAGGHCSEYHSTAGEVKTYETALETYEAEKTLKEETHETLPSPPAEPSYAKSFCSYHGEIGSNPSTILLYGAIPWTAGGLADGHLPPADETSGYPCQDGGFVSEGGEIEKQSTPHPEEPNEINKSTGPDGTYDHGLADLIVNQIAVEQQDIVTDPLLNGWKDSEGNEVTDECRNFFLPTIGGSESINANTKAGNLFNQDLGAGNYYINEPYNRAAAIVSHTGTEFPGLPFPGVGCVPGVSLVPQFTAPNVVKGEEVIGFNGMESNVTLDSAVNYVGGVEHPNYAIYTWSFDDGERGDATPEVSGYAPGSPACEAPWLSSPRPSEGVPANSTWIGCAASVFHKYRYTGNYEVSLLIRDVAGNEAETSHDVSVEGETPPGGGGGSSGGGGGGGSSSGSGSSGPSSGGGSAAAGAGAGTASATGTPVATAAILSKTLAPVLRSGLTVHYSVNQQVAGRFEVLLASSVARRIGLHGTPATGLAKGTPPQIVIAKAILVTTKSGVGTVKIEFGPKTAARLRKLGKVSLMVRLAVHNHASQTTTVLGSVTLGR